MDRGAWRATVHGVAKRRTRLSDFIFNRRKLSLAVTENSLISSLGVHLIK